jgi:energy-coupling factor transporter ATP-binding protein EcfA2
VLIRIAISEVGGFVGEASAGVPWSPVTLIHGDNGSGKTTLCEVLESCAAGQPAMVLARRRLPEKSPPRVELELPHAERRVFDGARWDGEWPQAQVFGDRFVNANVHVGDRIEHPQRRSLFRALIGEEAVKLARRVEDLSAALRGVARRATDWMLEGARRQVGHACPYCAADTQGNAQVVERRAAFDRALSEARKRYGQLTGLKAAARAQLERASARTLQEHQARINRTLERLDAGFRLGRLSPGHAGGIPGVACVLVIGGEPVPLGPARPPTDRPAFGNTLGAGDRRMLALAFYLSRLDELGDAAGGARSAVAILDDPFAGLDVRRRARLARLLAELAPRLAQLVVLSHDETALRVLGRECGAAARVARLRLESGVGEGVRLREWRVEGAGEARGVERGLPGVGVRLPPPAATSRPAHSPK